MNFILAVTILCALCLAANSSSSDVDDFFDSVLKYRYPSELAKLVGNDVRLPAFDVHFQNRTSEGSITNGQVKFSEGKVSGLSDLVRNGSCSGITWEFANMTASCVIVAPLIRVNYNASIRYESSELVRNVTAQVNFTDHYVYVRVSSSPRYNIPSLKEVRVVKRSTASVVIRGIQQLHYEALVETLRKTADKNLSSMEGKFIQAFGNSIKYESLPLD